MGAKGGKFAWKNNENKNKKSQTDKRSRAELSVLRAFVFSSASSWAGGVVLFGYATKGKFSRATSQP